MSAGDVRRPRPVPHARPVPRAPRPVAGQPARGERPPRAAPSKVPEVTPYFWIIKVLTTFLGEATSDYLVHTISPYLAVGLGFAVFAISLAAQFAVRRYVAWIYWTTVAMVAVFGTMAADVLHVALHVPYTVSTAFFLVAIAVIFLAWYRAERTLSIHSIRTPRREAFYWAAVVTAFALGTAAGDLTARTVGLGYLGAGIMFTLIILLPLIAYGFGLNDIASFWFAYIVTRPVGASFADWLGFPPSVGGLGLGHGPIALSAAAVFVALVGYVAARRVDYPRAQSGPARADYPRRPTGRHGALSAGRPPTR